MSVNYPESTSRTYVDESKIRDHSLDLTDDLGLRRSVKGLKFHIENGLLLWFLLLISSTWSMNTSKCVQERGMVSHLFCCFFDRYGGGWCRARSGGHGDFLNV